MTIWAYLNLKQVLTVAELNLKQLRKSEQKETGIYTTMKKLQRFNADNSILTGNVPVPIGSVDMTAQEVDSVAYFFVRLKSISPQQYDLLMPDDKTESIVKREHAAYVKDLTRAQIDKGMAVYHKKKQAGDKKYTFLDLDIVIGLIVHGEGSGMNSGAYKDFYARDENGIAKRLPEPEYQRQNRKEKGLQHTSRILNMFDDEG